MKLRTLVVAGMGAAVGYVLGTRDGRVRYEQIKTRTSSLLSDPTVQRNLANFTNSAAEAATKVPGPTGPLLRTAAQRLNDTVAARGPEDPASDPLAPTPDPVVPPPGPDGPSRI